MLVCIIGVAIHACINIWSNMYVHVDLRLWILHSDLGHPSQIIDLEKNEKASINDPNCGRGQCSQSTMGTGMGWTTLH